MSQRPTDLTRRGPKSRVDLVAPAERLQRREAFGDEALPGFGGVAAAEDEDQPAFFGLAGGHPHLHETVLADGVQRGGFGACGRAGRRPGRPGVGADELPVVVERDRWRRRSRIRAAGRRAAASGRIRRGRGSGSGAGPGSCGRSTMTCSLTVGGSGRRFGGSARATGGAGQLRRDVGGLDADAADRAGGGIDVPRAGCRRR